MAAYHAIRPCDVERLYELNQANTNAVSSKSFEDFQQLVEHSFWNCCTDGATGFALAFDQTTDFPAYKGHVVFDWFKQRYPDFVYLDRICVASNERGHRIGTGLHAELAAFMRAHDRRVLCLAIYTDPPNPRSYAFHTALGFKVVGKERIYNGTKEVQYLVREENELV